MSGARDKTACSPTACRAHCVQSRGGINMSRVDKVNPDLSESYTICKAADDFYDLNINIFL